MLFTAVAMISCSSPPKEAAAPAAKQAERRKPADESQRFPDTDRVQTKVVDEHLLDKPFMPGGTLAHYKKGKQEYDLFAGKADSPTDAASRCSIGRRR